MKKTLKRFGKMALAAVLMLSMLVTSVPAMASSADEEAAAAADNDKTETVIVDPDGDTPTSNDKGTIRIKNVESGATVTAYQITEAQYENNAFTGYTAVKGVSIKDPMNPTADEIATIAKNVGSLKNSVVLEQQESGDYEGSAAPGYWIVIVSNTNSANIYNPMLAGVYYSKDATHNEMTSEVIDAGTMFTINCDEIYAKKSTPTIDKKITNHKDGNESGASFAVGDVIDFQITADIPTYGPTFTSITYKISDKMSDGLDYFSDSSRKFTISVNGENLTPSEVTKSIKGMWDESTTDELDPRSSEIEFTEDFVKKYAGKKVTVTYYAKLNDSAKTNFAGDDNINTATLTYSNNPDDTTDTNTNEDKTYQYTFDIGGYLNGEGSERTDTLWKVGPGNTATKKGDVVTSVSKALPGAEFTLYYGDENGDITDKVFGKMTTGDDGRIEFKGLAGDTNYVLVETKAPTVDGVTYKLDSTQHKVRINTSYFDSGMLESFTIKIDGKETAQYTRTETAPTDISIVKDEATFIVNTTFGKLPSTGGAGTAALVIVGLGLVAYGLRRSRKNMAAR